jgi:hypothetical protein
MLREILNGIKYLGMKLNKINQLRKLLKNNN